MKNSFIAAAFAVALGGGVVAACSSSNNTVTDTSDSGPVCGAGSTVCGASCTSLANDNTNCGACGTACKAGQICSKGACAASCGGGTTQCGSTCNDTQVDPNNCGGCGTKCKQGEVCSAGKCASNCAMGQTTCGNSCVNTMTDNVNCGGCGTICQAGQVCSSGKCALTCQQGLTLCNMAQDGGAPDASVDASSDGGSSLGFPYCANTQTDDSNCGGCGIQCGNGQQCVAGSCSTTCGGVLTQCPGQDGGANYCSDTSSDPNNCGACGTVCQNGQNCVNKVCTKPLLPIACTTGKDPQTSSPYVLCKATLAELWISANTGGTFHATEICNLYGYTKLGKYGGTCGNVCGYCQGATSCNSLGNENFDNGGNVGSDQYGQKLSNTVMWQCLP